MTPAQERRQRVAELRENPKRIVAALFEYSTVLKAAESLGVSERTLYKLIKELGL